MQLRRNGEYKWYNVLGLRVKFTEFTIFLYELDYTRFIFGEVERGKFDLVSQLSRTKTCLVGCVVWLLLIY